VITTIAGFIKVDTLTVDSANSISLKQPSGLCLASDGSIYINDTGNNRVIKLQAKTFQASLFAGTGVAGYSGDGGKAIEATLNAPYGIACFQRYIYIADRFNSVIRKIDTTSRIISTVAGNGSAGFSGDGGMAISAQLAEPHGIAVDARGNIFFADTNNGRIRRVDGVTGIISTFPAPVSGSTASTPITPNPYGVFISKAQEIYVGDRTRNQIILIGSATKR
jgi:streptogramin lyase